MSELKAEQWLDYAGEPRPCYPKSEADKVIAGLKEGDLFKVEPYMQLKMVNGSHSMWVPSVNDCLSNDWAITK